MAASGFGQPKLASAKSPTSGIASNSRASVAVRSGLQVPCSSCRKRKVRCNKLLPCSNCERFGFDCSYDEPNRGSKPYSSSARNISKAFGPMRSLQNTIPSFQQNSTTSTAAPVPPYASMLFAGPQSKVTANSDVGILLSTSDKSRHVVTSFWPGLFHEIDSLNYLIEESGCSTNDRGSSPLQSLNTQEADLNVVHLESDDYHADRLCDIFFKNVDPFIKLLHKPSFHSDLAQYRNGGLRDRARFKALQSSMHCLAVMSLSDDYIYINFAQETKSTLLRKLQAATETALAASRFMQSHSLQSFQAYLLYLAALFARNEHIHASELTGFAFRIARNMGLHRDGSHYNLSPWHIEMRRRAWLFLCILDVKTLESLGAEPETSLLNSDTSPPQNSPDSAWEPSESSTVTAKLEKGFTEMTYNLVQSELSFLMRTILDGTHSLFESTDAYVDFHGPRIEQEKDRITSTYLKDLDVTDPIQSLVFTTTELFFSKAFLIIHQPLLKFSSNENGVPPNLRDRIFVTAIGVCEISHNLEIEYKELQWDWIFQSSTQWHAIAIILTNLLHRSNDPNIPRAWKQVDIIFERYYRDVAGSGDARLWRPLVKLWSDATLRRNVDADFQTFQKGPASGEPVETFGLLQEEMYDQWWDPALFGAGAPSTL